MLEFIFAEKGFVEMFSSMGRFTLGIGLLEMPLSYRRALSALDFYQSGLKLVKSIYREQRQLGKHLKGVGARSEDHRLIRAAIFGA